MPASHQVRWLCKNDTDAVLRIDADAFGGERLTEDSLTAVLQQPRTHSLVAIDETHAVIGFMIYTYTSKSVALVTRIAVASGKRKQGVGSALMQHLLGKLLYKDDARVSTYVMENMSEAIDWFRRQGFKVWGLTPGEQPENGQDVYYLGRNVDGICEAV